MAKKSKKEYSDFTVHKYFNVNKVPSRHTAVLMKDMLVRAENILKEHDITMEPWCTLDGLAEKTIDIWEYDPIDQKYWWMDKYIEEIGYMIWNDVNRKYHQDWFKTGILVDVPGLVKRSRNGEGVADHFAVTAVAKFTEPYE